MPRHKKIFQKDIDLLFEIGSFKFINRNWEQYLKVEMSNLAEHHFRVIWISLILAKYEKVKNTDEIIKMALFHDLGESRTGDLARGQKNYATQLEEKAIKDIAKGSVLKNEIYSLWREYQERKSMEAKIVKDADNLDVDFEMREKEIAGYQFPQKWKIGRKKLSETKYYSKTAKKIWKLLQKTNPHNWHIETGSI